MTTAPSTHLPLCTTPTSKDYESLRQRYINTLVPPLHPASIICPKSVSDVVSAIQLANTAHLPIGVRSGGHSFPCASLYQDGLLIDTRDLNRGVEYDEATGTIAFGPAVTVREMSEAMLKVGRFFPHGHAPTVGMGGFCLAGGQGWFMRGWGCTAETWLTKMEVVMPSGDVVMASKDENADVWWAARGSGQAFFGVVTKFWAKTIPARKLFHRTQVFVVGNAFADLLKWAFDCNDEMPKEGTEASVCTFYADKYTPGVVGEEVQSSTLMMAMEIVVYKDSIGEAEEVLRAWDHVPEALREKLVLDEKVRTVTWTELFQDQDNLIPTAMGERWLCDSILNKPNGSRDELIEAIRPALCDLPSRRSAGCIYIADTYPIEGAMAFSLPQQYYIATFVGWTDPTWDLRMKAWLKKAYLKADKSSCGSYIADFEASHRVTRVMTDTALEKFLSIRKKWDPEDRFPKYKDISLVSDSTDVRLSIEMASENHVITNSSIPVAS